AVAASVAVGVDVAVAVGGGVVHTPRRPKPGMSIDVQRLSGVQGLPSSHARPWLIGSQAPVDGLHGLEGPEQDGGVSHRPVSPEQPSDVHGSPSSGHSTKDESHSTWSLNWRHVPVVHVRKPGQGWSTFSGTGTQIKMLGSSGSTG